MRRPHRILAGLSLAACLIAPTTWADDAPTDADVKAAMGDMVAPPAHKPEPKGNPVAPAKGAAVGAWTQDLAAAQLLASEKGLPILLNFTGSDWCGWCFKAEEAIFTRPAWQAYAKENMLLVSLDYPEDKSRVPEEYHERNMRLQEEYGIRGYPTFVIVASDGKTELGRLSMAPDITAESFIAQVEDTLTLMPERVDARVKALGDQGPAYRKAMDRLLAAQTALSDLEGQLGRNGLAEKRNRIAYFKARHEATLAQLGLMDFDIQDDIAKLQDTAKQTAAQSAWKALQASYIAQSEFLLGDPENTPENVKTFQGLNAELAANSQKLSAILSP